MGMIREMKIRRRGDLDDGLVLYYPFDQQADPITDISGHARHATIEGATWTGKGLTGGAIELDGINDYIFFEPDEGEDLTCKDMTLSMWVFEAKRRREDRDPAYARMLYFTYAHDVGMNEVSSSDGVLKYCVRGTLSSWQNSAVRIPQQKWTHVAFVVEGGKAFRIYVNGVERFDLGNSSGELGLLPITFGAWTQPGQGTHGFFSGKLDEIRLYSRALSAEEIEVLHAWPDDLRE